jgi:hypothetical protein
MSARLPRAFEADNRHCVDCRIGFAVALARCIKQVFRGNFPALEQVNHFMGLQLAEVGTCVVLHDCVVHE